MRTVAPATHTQEAEKPKSRRELHFETMQDILNEVESLASGPVISLGKWTPAQNIDHIRSVIRVAHAGTDFKMPLAYRILGKVLKGYFLKSSFKAGMKTEPIFEPPAEITMEQALAAFREDVEIASRPGAMSQPSPLFGAMTHEQWVQLNCRHAELHLGFLFPATN